MANLRISRRDWIIALAPAIPAAIVALLVGWLAYGSAKDAVDQQYVALAITILKEPQNAANKDLRGWGVDLLVKLAPSNAKPSPALARTLREGALLSLSACPAVDTTSAGGVLKP